MSNVKPQIDTNVPCISTGVGRRTKIDYGNKEETTERVR